MSIFLPLAVFILALLLQALFAGYETGFVSANPIRIRYQAEEEHSRRATLLLHHLQQRDLMLTALLIGTNVAVVIGTITVTSFLSQFDLDPVVTDLLATVIVAPILLVFAEIIPKSVFRTHPNRLTLILLPVIQFFFVALSPIVKPVSWLTRWLLHVKGGEDRPDSPFVIASLEHFRALVDESLDHGVIEPEEQEMIHSVIDLRSTQAKEIMVPRIHIHALPDTTTRDELIALFEKTGLTRIPIYHDTVDTIVGAVNAYDVILDDEPQHQDIERFVRDVIHVPDTLKVDDLFRALKAAKQHLAIVTDEYGGTDGLVTIEDILEEIFGEIHDEYDPEERPIQKVGPNAYAADALMTLDEVSEAIGVDILDDEVETLGGWLAHVAGHIPAPGQVIAHGRFQMTVLDGSARHVAKIRIEVLPEETKDKALSPSDEELNRS